MTLHELSQLYWLRREIREDEQRLHRLRLLAESVPSPNNDGMPRSSEVNSRVERVAVELVELEGLIAEKYAKSVSERLRLERWIAAIPDSLTRQVFTARFVEGLRWDEVAEYIGGGISASGVKKICYRYLDGRD